MPGDGKAEPFRTSNGTTALALSWFALSYGGYCSGSLSRLRTRYCMFSDRGAADACAGKERLAIKARSVPNGIAKERAEVDRISDAGDTKDSPSTSEKRHGDARFR